MRIQMENGGRLTEVQVKTVLPREKHYGMSDGGGLRLLVMASGSKYWQFRYTFAGKRETFTFGDWPSISLAQARRSAAAFRKQLAEGKNPKAERKLEEFRQTVTRMITFEAVAQDWLDYRRPDWSERHARDQADRVRRDILPYMPNKGRVPIGSLTAPDLVKVLRNVAKKSLDSAHRARSIVEQVFQHAVNTGSANLDPSTCLRQALPQAPSTHFPVPATVEALTSIVRRIDEAVPWMNVYMGTAVRLQELLGVRSGELCAMRWSEVNRDRAEWQRVASKTHRRHVVPLSRQAVALLDLAWAISGGTADGYVFPKLDRSGKHMSESSLVMALRRADVASHELVPHSWRGVLRTFGAQVCGFPAEWLEAALAHTPADRLGDTYNRTDWLEQRRGMMQAWADWLDTLRAAPIVPAVQAM